jgi:hypothetical protein
MIKYKLVLSQYVKCRLNCVSENRKTQVALMMDDAYSLQVAAPANTPYAVGFKYIQDLYISLTNSFFFN